MEEKVTVIIPNYNGKNLLAKNLPKVIATCPRSEIIVVDDASGDGSASFVKENFKRVKVIINHKNLGFAQAVNIGAKNAKGDYLLLLNTDVAPKEGFLNEALKHFKIKRHPRIQRHPGGDRGELFAVGLADQSHEDGKIITRGRGGAKFTKGFLSHFKAESKAGESLWVSGGSSLIDKNKFQDLRGFDLVYAPFYWEDIDLCYRARKLGYTCLFEPKAEVDHLHQEGAIKKHYSDKFIKTISYRNQFIFVWKNISDYFLLFMHIIWLTYHLIKSLVSLDSSFFLGFLWAIFKIPQLIFNYQLPTTNNRLTDKEVLKPFAKQ